MFVSVMDRSKVKNESMVCSVVGFTLLRLLYISLGKKWLCLQNVKVIIRGSAEQLFLEGIIQACRLLDIFSKSQKDSWLTDWYNTWAWATWLYFWPKFTDTAVSLFMKSINLILKEYNADCISENVLFESVSRFWGNLYMFKRKG